MANLIPEICKMLGLEIGEEFQIKGDNATYKFASDGLRLIHDNGSKHFDTTANMVLVDLLSGYAEIVKLSWKPKQDEKYWTFYINDEDALDADWSVWHEDVDDFARLKAGWVYRTEEEAKVELSKAAAEMGVDYEL